MSDHETPLSVQLQDAEREFNSVAYAEAAMIIGNYGLPAMALVYSGVEFVQNEPVQGVLGLVGGVAVGAFVKKVRSSITTPAADYWRDQVHSIRQQIDAR